MVSADEQTELIAGILRRPSIAMTKSFSKVGLLVLLGFIFAALQARAEDQARDLTACAARYRIAEKAVKGFTFMTYKKDQDSPACLAVRFNGHFVYHFVKNVSTFSLGQPGQPEYGVPSVADGADLTGRGNPDMIVTSFSGGAHCCTDLLLFELKPKFQLLATLHLGNRDLGHFAKDRLDHRFYFYGADDAFAYWHTSFAQSPAPHVILKWVDDPSKNGEFRMALDKMQGQQPTAKQWQQDYVRKARQAFQGDEAFADPETGPYLVGPSLWSSMLDLIYSERSPLAWKLLEEVWPASKPGKRVFVTDFCTQLTNSKYWSQLYPTLRESPQACTDTFQKASRN
jgi:hypothetical protein